MLRFLYKNIYAPFGISYSMLIIGFNNPSAFAVF